MRKNRQIFVRILCGFVTSMLLLLCVGCTKGPEEVLQEIDQSEVSLEGTEDEKDPIRSQTEESEGAEGPFTEGTDAEAQPETIYVYVCGEVVTPGVYKMQEGDRIYQAIEAAGGMTDQGAGWYLNQAERLSDGMKIYVPDEEAALALPRDQGMGQTGGKEQDKVDLNTATKEELMTLSGIGESKAESILRYREEKGGFQTIEEIQQVEGIKAGTYEKIKDRITVT